MGIVLTNGYVLNRQGQAVQMDIRIEEERIVEINRQIDTDGQQVIHCQGGCILPGLIDMHVHFRDPGFTHKETIQTGTRSAARGGFTTVACMPNTNPPLDKPEHIQYVHEKNAQEGIVRLWPIGAITRDQKGEELTDFRALKAQGMIGVSDDGVGVQSSKMMKEAMREAQRLNIPVIAHCEDDTFIGGPVHDGAFAEKHGLEGLPSEAESIHVGRDILLAEVTGVHYHVCHISCKQSVQLVREAKARGVHVTAEVTPHHLLLTEEHIPGLDTNYKMNPPLRTEADRQALIEGLLDGTIDIIATDHAPHTNEEKHQSMNDAPFGIVGLETAFPLLYTHLVQKGVFSFRELVDKLTTVPADLFGLPSGRLQEGALADIVVIDTQNQKSIRTEEFASKSTNTPFAGWNCQGWPTHTIVNGQLVWSDDSGFETAYKE